MGLTLHYQFTAANRTPTEVRAIIESLRTHAQSLDFESVSEIIELKGDACLFDPKDRGDPHAWLKVQTIRFEIDTERDVIAPTGEIHPAHIIAFTVKPGEGSEHANFGLCRYPNKTSNWSWSSFCKTQYASNPLAGDVANFLKCHLGLIAVLDEAKALGILKVVMDEGKYWDNRDVGALIKEVGMWNKMMAAFYGKHRDAVEAAGGDPRGLVAEIAKFGNFERLEAEGDRSV